MGNTSSCYRVNPTTTIITPKTKNGDNTSSKDKNSWGNIVNYYDGEDDDIDIDEDVVYSALFKLAFHFEIDESAPKELTCVICRHAQNSNFHAKCRDVQTWARNYANAKLSVKETIHLIKYVELYTPSPRSNFVGRGLSRIKVQPNPLDDFDYSYLTCPFRCQMAAWRAEINRQMLSTSVALYSDTVRCNISPSYSQRIVE